jgi:hypothetical protein
VVRWDGGELEELAVAGKQVTARLQGARLQARVRLDCHPHADDQWTVFFELDE